MNSLRARLHDAAWSAYVWPKGRVGNAVQGSLLQAIEGRRVRRLWDSASRVVLVHTPGKVGSKAIVAGVQPALEPDDAIFHTHRISPWTMEQARAERQGVAPRRTWYAADFLGQAVQQPGEKSVVVLAAVRDPMRRNLSAFFQNVERYRPSGRPLTRPDLDQADELAELFARQFPHEQIIHWVKSELEDVFGVDVYGAPFDHKCGYQVVRGDRAVVAIARHDALDGALPRMTQDVLGLSVGSPPRVNDSSSKLYGPLYKAVYDRLQLESAVVERMYCSSYARHFFTQSERRATINSILGGTRA